MKALLNVLFPPRRRAAAKPPPPRPLLVSGVPAPLELRISTRTRRLLLRVDAGRGLIQVVVPPGVGEAEAARFVGRHAAWVRSRLDAMPPSRPFEPGARVPVLGIEHVIRHDPALRGPGRRVGGEIVVGGRPEQVPGRVRRLLMAEARTLISARAWTMAAALGVRVAALTLRDTRSRWGSCSSSGRLSFSWRLILAPESVLDYVVAHEVAHLSELNHSPRFWAEVARLVPHVNRSRSWLRANGAALLRFG